LLSFPFSLGFEQQSASVQAFSFSWILSHKNKGVNTFGEKKGFFDLKNQNPQRRD
jgi:hypothetical protein